MGSSAVKNIRLQLQSLFLLAIASFYMAYNLLANPKSSASSETERQEHDDPAGDSMMSKDPVFQMPELLKYPKNVVPFHVAMTATAEPYSQWHSRIMYYWYLKEKVQTWVGSPGFFTLESLTTGWTKFPLVDALPSGLHCTTYTMGFRAMATIEEEYIFMAEPDRIFLKPIPNFAVGDLPAGYPFFYIKLVEHEKLSRKFFPEAMGPVTNIDPIGNSPVMIKKVSGVGNNLGEDKAKKLCTREGQMKSKVTVYESPEENRTAIFVPLPQLHSQYQ